MHRTQPVPSEISAVDHALHEGADRNGRSVPKRADEPKRSRHEEQLHDEPPSTRPRNLSSRQEELLPTGVWVMAGTHQCALAGCVPCRAKVLQAAGATTVPNARPESCPRFVPEGAPSPHREVATHPIGLYTPDQLLLTVGDGDLTFALALARALGGGRVVASSYESRAALVRIYGAKVEAVIAELEALGARVAYGVDAANLGSTLPAELQPAGGYDRVVWNFPCAIDACAHSGADARVRGAEELAQNRSLLSRFFSSAAALLTAAGGEVG